MITFITCILVLILGYIVYGKIVDKQFGMDPNRPTPVKTMADGVDYVEMPLWRIFLIQLLNIAGLGPIFGAILGAMYGPIAYLWIVLGSIFMGGVHDYFSGMMSLRHKGMTIPEFTGEYMGPVFKNIMRVITFFCLILVGAAFVNGPAGLLTTLANNAIDYRIWVGIICIYYALATLLPIDVIIGKIYPFFGFVLVFMVVCLTGYMLFSGMPMQEFNMSAFQNHHSNQSENMLYPMIFIIVSCGAISGFHSTQSPLMSRCMTNENQGRKVFFGAMIAEGIIALIWATAAINYFGGPEKLNAITSMPNHNPAWVVNEICNSWLGKLGAVVAIMGVIALPITTGDTAFRSARLLIADIFHVDQKKMSKRLLVAGPILIGGFYLSQIDFTIIWKYFGVINQLLAVIILWTSAVFLVRIKKNHIIVSIPATLLSGIVATYFLIAPNKLGGLGIDANFSYIGGAVIGIATLIIFLISMKRQNKNVETELTI
ncbi:MAG: carbon starvation CstA family protein [bacterium]